MRSLIPWRRREVAASPETSVDLFRKEMDDLFSDFFGGTWWPERAWTRRFAPAFDLSETETEFLVKAELPGVDPKAVEVNLMGNVLTIKGEKREEKEEKGESMHTVERSFGSFSRSFRLPTDVVEDKVEAVLKDGVLSMKLPKAESAKKKNIKIDVKP
jgi:HSP20 family protein